MKRDFLSLADCSSAEVRSLLELAIALKRERAQGGHPPRLAGKALAMIFQKPSLRTRVSFEMGMEHLGGHALYLSPDEIKLGLRESIPDVARVLSRYVDGIMARVFSHADVLDLARWASVPVINGLSDFSHPCQGLTDLLTIYEHLGRLEGVRLAYVGDGNNTLHSLLFGGALTGMQVVAATPEGYDPSPDAVRVAESLAAQTGASVRLLRDAHEAVRGGRCGLHRCLDQYGPGGRGPGAPARLSALPGERRSSCRSPRGGGCHALLAGSPWRRDHR